MTQQIFVWSSPKTHTFEVLGEWPEPVTVTARPIITCDYFDTSVGLYYRDISGFGHWHCSCSPVVAWRVAQILPRVQRIRNYRRNYDETLSGLVEVMRGNRGEDRMRECARDLGITPDELESELARLSGLWPSATELRSIWLKLPENAQDKFAPAVRRALDEGDLNQYEPLIALVEQAEVRLRSAADQQQREDDLITLGLDGEPTASLKMLMFDLGVTNLVYTRGYGDIGEPSHFGMTDLDRDIMRELIGKYGVCDQIELLTSAKGPNDPTAHWSSGGGDVIVFGSDFGEMTHPKVKLADQIKDLVYVRFDRVTERFQLAVRPAGVKHSDDDVLMTIEQIRQTIGYDNDLGDLLMPGLKAPWVEVDTDQTKAVESKPFWGWLKELLPNQLTSTR